MSVTVSSKIGFIGLGIMGSGMAANLAKAGRELVIWNRTATKATEFSSTYPAAVADTPREVVAACDVTYLMLSTPAAAQAVYNGEDGVLAAVSQGKTIVDCATLTPEDMIHFSAQVKSRNGNFLEAPVSGSKGPAENGTLLFLTAGDRSAFEQTQADLDIMGKASFFLGEVGAGTRMKLVVNMIMGSMLASLGEGLNLARGSGLNAEDLLQILDQGACSNPMFRLKGSNMSNGVYEPHFPLKHAQKDMRFALGLGDELGQSLPVAAAANEVYKRVKKEYGDHDFSAVIEGSKSSSDTSK